MNDLQRIFKAKEALDASPLRRRLKDDGQAPVVIDEDLFKAEEEKMDKLVKNVDSSLKVVIMGEVKAGKSTLLNAFAGSNVSPTDVAEATGAVIEIKYHPEEYGAIHLDDHSIEGVPEEIYNKLGEHNNNQEFFNRSKSVEFGFPISNLKEFTLVDTPGLETITEDNSNRTKDYVAETDVVLWVFNGHHLGQSDIEEALIEVNRLGKPIIAVINRIDEIDEDPEVLIDYLDEEIGMFVESVIAISAWKANQSVMSADDDLLEESGFEHLLEYIHANISSKSEEVKKDVIFSSAQSLLNRDLLLHEEYLKTVGFLEEQMNNIYKKIDMYSSRIYNHILYSFENWYKHEFLNEEKEDMKKIIQDSGYWSLKKDKKEVDSHLQSIFSEAYISNILNEKITRLDEMYAEEWEEALEQVKKDVQIEIYEFKNEAEKELELKITHSQGLNDGDADLLAGASKGAWLGGATGAASAFYAAALGPAAATVTAGMAVSAFIPPMLFVGATIGVVSSALKFKSEKNLAEKNIDDVFKEVKGEYVQDILYSLREKYSTQNEKVKENIQTMIVDSFVNGAEQDDINLLKREIENYLYRIKITNEDLQLVHK
ncbi:dynamin family protein [Halobacillus trueperi]|uniref:GTP-binding protein n=1 Tax=Halobacillus trueperi TaxID=156205 RepID=A0A3E0JBN2_9BACI|nr:dynamin family protein [Halobacillus trueperi]REJ10345.1 GTP-binding protein [Halobacillus trueperi]